MQMEISPKSRFVAFLCAFFLGVFGVHRFYVGKIGTGLLYMFSFGLFGLGLLFDLLAILIGSFRDKEGRTLLVWL